MPQTIDPRPTVDAPDDDPYLWLEEIEGARGARLGRGAEPRRPWRGSAMPRFAADRDALAAIFDRPDNIPVIARRGDRVFNFWKDAAHPRGVWRTTTLDELPRRDAELATSCSTSTRSPRAEGEDWIWGGASTIPGPSRPRHPETVARRRRCRGVARVRPAVGRVRRRRFRAAGGQKRRRLARSRHVAAVLGPGRRHGDPFGLCPHRAAVAARRRPARRPGDFRHRRRPHGGLRPISTARPRPSAIWFVERLGFFDAIVWLGDRTGPKTRIDLPTDASFDWHRGWLAVKRRHALDHRRRDLSARYRARHFARRVPRRRPRFHQAVRAGRAARVAGLLLVRRPARPVDPRRFAARCSRC